MFKIVFYREQPRSTGYNVVFVYLLVVGLGARPQLKRGGKKCFGIDLEKREGGQSLAGLQAPPGINRCKKVS